MVRCWFGHGTIMAHPPKRGQVNLKSWAFNCHELPQVGRVTGWIFDRFLFFKGPLWCLAWGFVSTNPFLAVQVEGIWKNSDTSTDFYGTKAFTYVYCLYTFIMTTAVLKMTVTDHDRPSTAAGLRAVAVHWSSSIGKLQSLACRVSISEGHSWQMYH